ncbi:MAG: hypothetical protein ACYTGZ_03510 [Planctomycetota bacterium]|jgi:hypothetical protein
MLRSLAFLLVAAAAFAGPSKFLPDVEHPLSPGTPLTFKFTPFWCNQCATGTPGLEQPKGKVTLLRLEPQKLADDIDLDKGWIVIQTAHFRILSTLRKSKIKKKDGRFVLYDLQRLQQIFPKFKIGREGASLTAHQRAHLYQIRAERVYAHFSTLTNNKKANLGMLARYELYLFDDYAEHHRLADKYIGRANDKAGLQDHRREKPNFMMFTTAESQVAENDGKGDKFLANHFVHNVVHLLADGSGNYYRETWAWLEEGLAHYYERMENPKHNTFCWAEGTKPDDLLKSSWQATIYNIVRRKKDTPLSEWCEKLQPGELTAQEHGLCWSIVKWLAENEQARLAKLMTRIDDIKAKPTSTEAIQFAFGVPPTVLHQRWREWVIEQGKSKK